MAAAQPLVTYVNGLDTPKRLRRTWLLEDVFGPLGIRPGSALEDACENVVVDVVSDEKSFRIRPKGWRVDLDDAALRPLLVGAIVGGALQQVVGDDVPAELYPAVVPLVIDVDGVTLEQHERVVTIPLTLALSPTDSRPSSTDLQVRFNRLSPRARAELGFDDFEHFCERLVKAARIGDADFGEVRVIANLDPTSIRLTWH